MTVYTQTNKADSSAKIISNNIHLIKLFFHYDSLIMKQSRRTQHFNTIESISGFRLHLTYLFYNCLAGRYFYFIGWMLVSFSWMLTPLLVLF